ncbi:MAG: DnaJ domain-containing protein [Cellvibrionaceae bacterium]|nr:DnaJ domain-containing protein [Cellvibrionaceae bacterium]
MSSPEVLQNGEWEQCLRLIAEYLLDRRCSKEYELVSHITRHLDFSWHSDPLMSIFQKHFLVRHSLYTINTFWPQKKQLRLDIGPVDIAVQPCHDGDSQRLSTESSSHLAAFYLDKNQFYAMRVERVAEMIAGFWQSYQVHSQKASAFQVLGVPDKADWQTIKRHYRSLVMTAHPDRGGDAKVFAGIKEAYEQLKTLYAK